MARSSPGDPSATRKSRTVGVRPAWLGVSAGTRYHKSRSVPYNSNCAGQSP